MCVEKRGETSSREKKKGDRRRKYDGGQVKNNPPLGEELHLHQVKVQTQK